MPSNSNNTARKRTGDRPARNAVDPNEHVFLTPAEARGEAAYLVMHLMLRRIPRSMCKSLMAQAYLQSDSLGIEAVTAEVDALFANIDFRDQA